MEQGAFKPGVLTKIAAQKKNPDRVSLFIDGEFRIGLDRKILSAHQLEVGAFIDAGMLREFIEREEFRKALVRAYRLLARRAHSCAQLEKKLLEKGFHPAVIGKVIDQLLAEKYLDDRAFALAYCNSRLLTRPVGRICLMHELKISGVEQNIIDEITAVVYAETPEEALAESVLQKKEKSFSRFDEKIAEKKKIQFLKNRGFAWDVIRKVL